MTYRTTITLDDEAASFLQRHGGDNKSAFIAKLIQDEKRRSLQARVVAANRDEATDADYQEDLSAWDATLPDGLAE